MWSDAQQTDTRQQLDELAEKIRRSMVSDPENYAEREPWWMERDALNRQNNTATR